MLVVGGGLAILLLPPIFGDFGALAEKARHGSLTSESLGTALELLMGLGARSVQAITLAIMAIGALSIGRKLPKFGLVLGTSAAVAILAILIIRPSGIEFSIVVARYALFLLPVLLILLAAGLSLIGRRMTGMLRPAALIL